MPQHTHLTIHPQNALNCRYIHTLFFTVPRSVLYILVVDGKSRYAMVPAFGMVFYPRILVLGIGRFQAAVAFLAWLLRSRFISHIPINLV